MQMDLLPNANEVVLRSGDVTFVVDPEDTAFTVVIAHSASPAEEADSSVRAQSHNVVYLTIRGGTPSP